MEYRGVLKHFLIGSLLFVVLITVVNFSITEKTETTVEIDTTVCEVNLPLTDSVKQFIKFMNLDYPDIVYAQAVLESNYFGSDLFVSNYNMFGMKEAMIRNSVALGTRNGFAYYKNWEHSIIDYALYQATYYHTSTRKLTRQEYLDKLSRTYASDPEYIAKLENIMRKEDFYIE